MLVMALWKIGLYTTRDTSECYRCNGGYYFYDKSNMRASSALAVYASYLRVWVLDFTSARLVNFGPLDEWIMDEGLKDSHEGLLVGPENR